MVKRLGQSDLIFFTLYSKNQNFKLAYWEGKNQKNQKTTIVHFNLYINTTKNHR